MKLIVTLFLGILISLSSCQYFRPNLMMRTKKDFVFDTISISASSSEYKIARNDQVEYRITSNNGYRLVDIKDINMINNRSELTAYVESDGFVKFPLIGRVKLEGLTLQEAERRVEELFSKFYVDPFVNIKVSSKRVIVFPGNAGQAKVILLPYNNMTLLEVIALAGGISDEGKAYNVKLIRNENGQQNKSYIYKMDLSSIQGAQIGKLVVQAGDVIYVEPFNRPLVLLNKEVTPLLTLMTTLFLLVFQVVNLSNR